ncbi:hypothetical protein Pelo_17186 [Pelomyxa schiedti]|nr:hypothetical protein Pelo_17186 [Pelomyxa schiedti]
MSGAPGDVKRVQESWALIGAKSHRFAFTPTATFRGTISVDGTALLQCVSGGKMAPCHLLANEPSAIDTYSAVECCCWGEGKSVAFGNLHHSSRRRFIHLPLKEPLNMPRPASLRNISATESLSNPSSTASTSASKASTSASTASTSATTGSAMCAECACASAIFQSHIPPDLWVGQPYAWQVLYEALEEAHVKVVFPHDFHLQKLQGSAKKRIYMQ